MRIMWIENMTWKEDLDALCKTPFIPWSDFNKKTIFVTGATGLIGSSLVSALLYYEKISSCGLRVIALVRNREKAEAMFSPHLKDNCPLSFVYGDMEDLPEISDIDYVIHCACPTASAYFVSHPADTMNSILTGTKNILELAREKVVKGMVYLSSMEVYGEIRDRRALKEEDLGYIDPLSARSCYPIGKRGAEALCLAYREQYGIPVVIARLAQTFGPGVGADDSRVFAYMTRCALSGQDICLNTDGSKENMFLYTADAVSAILLLLAKGERGCIYNVANEDTYCSIKEMGELVLRTFGNGGCVKTRQAPSVAGIYQPQSFLKLDVSRLRGTGWTPYVPLAEMYIRMAQGCGWMERMESE